MLNVTVKLPRVLSSEITVKITSPPSVRVCEDGVTFKLVAAVEAEMDPDPSRVNLIVMEAEPPFFPIATADGVATALHAL